MLKNFDFLKNPKIIICLVLIIFFIALTLTRSSRSNRSEANGGYYYYKKQCEDLEFKGPRIAVVEKNSVKTHPGKHIVVNNACYYYCGESVKSLNRNRNYAPVNKKDLKKAIVLTGMPETDNGKCQRSLATKKTVNACSKDKSSLWASTYCTVKELHHCIPDKKKLFCQNTAADCTLSCKEGFRTCPNPSNPHSWKICQNMMDKCLYFCYKKQVECIRRKEKYPAVR